MRNGITYLLNLFFFLFYLFVLTLYICFNLCLNVAPHICFDVWWRDLPSSLRAAPQGFFAGSNPANPADWAGQSGQDFNRNNQYMDFAVTHAWPDNWQM